MTAQEIQTTEGGQLKAAWKLGQALSQADIVPQNFRGKEANCFVALDIAQRLGASVFEIMQNLAVIKGTPSWKASYAIAMANSRGPFLGPICFDYDTSDPENPKARAYATVEATGAVVESVVDMNMAKAEGWTRNAKYQTIPQQMLCYRAGAFLVRLYCPEVLLGLHMADEIEDVQASAGEREVEIEPTGAVVDMAQIMGGDEPESPTVDEVVDNLVANVDIPQEPEVDEFGQEIAR